MEKLLSAVPDLARIFMISIVVDAAIWLSLAEFQSILLTDPYTLLGVLAATSSIVWIISAMIRKETRRKQSRKRGFQTASYQSCLCHSPNQFHRFPNDRCGLRPAPLN